MKGEQSTRGWKKLCIYEKNVMMMLGRGEIIYMTYETIQQRYFGDI